MRYIILVALLISINVAQSQTLLDTGKASVVWQYFNTKQYEGDKRLYTKDDLYPPYAVKGQASDSMIEQYLRLLRNEIYARHGRVFNNSELQEFYITMPWYKKNKVVEVNSFEKQNVVIVQNEEGKYKKLSNTPEKQKSKSVGYVKKILIEAQWGDGQGQYGLDFNTAPGPTGPTDFTISLKGEIYILDNCGKYLRVNKYNRDGVYIGEMYYYKNGTLTYNDRFENMLDKILVDNNDDILLIGYNNKKANGIVKLINWKENILVENEIPWKIYGAMKNVFIENEDIIFENNSIDESGKNINEEKWVIPYKVKSNISNISNCKPVNSLLCNIPKGNLRYFGTDFEKNNYFYDFIGQDTILISKYTQDGININNVFITEERYIAVPEIIIKVDISGNVYFMSTRRDGLSIIKFIK